MGGGFLYGGSNYNSLQVIGGTVYSSFDIKRHLGVEVDFHQAKASGGLDVYERTYEVGGRYHWNTGPMVPYGKVMVGRGVFNYPNDVANIAYNVVTAGGGADFHVLRSLNVRADYEYQTWFGFPLADLHPSLVTIGVAYHFHE